MLPRHRMFTHLLSRHAEDVIAQDAVEEVRPLTGGNQREAGVVGIVRADAAAWLDWVGENPVIDKLQLRHMSGLGEGRLHGSARSEEHTSELQSLRHLVCRLLLEKKKNNI